MTSEAGDPHDPAPDDGAAGTSDQGSGLKGFLLLVLVIFGLILAAVAAFAFFGPDSGLLPFDYEGA